MIKMFELSRRIENKKINYLFLNEQWRRGMEPRRTIHEINQFYWFVEWMWLAALHQLSEMKKQTEWKGVCWWMERMGRWRPGGRSQSTNHKSNKFMALNEFVIDLLVLLMANEAATPSATAKTTHPAINLPLFLKEKMDLLGLLCWWAEWIL